MVKTGPFHPHCIKEFKNTVQLTLDPMNWNEIRKVSRLHSNSSISYVLYNLLPQLTLNQPLPKVFTVLDDDFRPIETWFQNGFPTEGTLKSEPVTINKHKFGSTGSF